MLILDEATSALDPESEHLVQTALDTLKQGRTTPIFAHRLSTIEKVDHIVVLQHGGIAQIGTHVELLAREELHAYPYKNPFADEDGMSEEQQHAALARSSRPSAV